MGHPPKRRGPAPRSGGGGHPPGTQTKWVRGRPGGTRKMRRSLPDTGDGGSLACRCWRVGSAGEEVAGHRACPARLRPTRWSRGRGAADRRRRAAAGCELHPRSCRHRQVASAGGGRASTHDRRRRRHRLQRHRSDGGDSSAMMAETADGGVAVGGTVPFRVLCTIVDLDLLVELASRRLLVSRSTRSTSRWTTPSSPRPCSQR